MFQLITISNVTKREIGTKLLKYFLKFINKKKSNVNISIQLPYLTKKLYQKALSLIPLGSISK